MLRILLAHNYYGSSAPSGENQVFELEKALLERRGHDVCVYVRRSDEIRRRGVLGALQGAVATPWNPRTVGEIRRTIDEFKPDVVHVHNTFPLISPSIFAAVGKRAARVLTLHNYRLFCPAAIPLRDGKPCTLCLDRHSAVPAVRYGCYRGSRAATLPLAIGVTLHRRAGTWQRDVDAFIALTEFQRERMVAAGLPADKVFVKTNFYPGRPAVLPWAERDDCVVFAGRLTEEKGVLSLVQAWSAWGREAPELRIVGDGALRGQLESAAQRSGARVTFLGQLSPARAETQIGKARLLILPSICFEGFPMVLREAFAFGTPAAVSGIGPLPGIVRHGHTGVVFRVNDASSLLETVRELWRSPESLATMSAHARREYEDKYAESANYEQLLRIYQRAIAVHDQRGAA